MNRAHVLTTLAEQLPTRLNAARSNGLDCVRLTLAEEIGRAHV